VDDSEETQMTFESKRHDVRPGDLLRDRTAYSYSNATFVLLLDVSNYVQKYVYFRRNGVAQAQYTISPGIGFATDSWECVARVTDDKMVT